MIHKTAIISSSAKISENVKIGPYCIIDSNVIIGEGSELISHVYISGNTANVGTGTGGGGGIYAMGGSVIGDNIIVYNNS